MACALSTGLVTLNITSMPWPLPPISLCTLIRTVSIPFRWLGVRVDEQIDQQRLDGIGIGRDPGVTGRFCPAEFQAVQCALAGQRLFAFITMNWRGKPLLSHQVSVQLISAITTETGLGVCCEIDATTYPKGLQMN